jgi:nucleoid-associated protein YgaU
MSRKIVWASIALIALVCVSSFAQALSDNKDYKQALQLQAKAEQAYADGDYQAAYTYSEQAKQYSTKADEYASTLAVRYRASNWLNLAKQKMGDAEDMGAKERYPEEYGQAVDNYANAQVAFKETRWEDSIEYSKNVVAWLADVKPAPPVEEEAVTVAEEPVFPKYYVVRLILDDRDCFHKIAAYTWVYNDKYEWRPLYEANKDKLRQPNNPHLINPGQVFIIPSLHGEKREGTWDPHKTYPVFGED